MWSQEFCRIKSSKQKMDMTTRMSLSQSNNLLTSGKNPKLFLTSLFSIVRTLGISMTKANGIFGPAQ